MKLLFLSGLAPVLLLSQPCSGANVSTPRKPVTTQYHGQNVVDDYLWLENGADPSVRKWTEAQNRQTRLWLDKSAIRPHVESRLKQLYASTSPNYFGLQPRRGKLFALKFKPPLQQPLLVIMEAPDVLKSERVVLDPNLLDLKGTTSIDWYVASPDARLVAVSLSEKGSEDGTLHFYEVGTGRKLSDVIPRVQYPTAGGSATWTADGMGLFYTRYPRAGERAAEDLHFYQQVYFHKLGTKSEQDTYEIGREFPRIAEIEIQTSPDGRYLLATVANGDGGDYAHYLRSGPTGQWRQIARFEDQIKRVEFGRDPLYLEWPKDDALYLLSRQNAPRGKILRLALNATNLADATEIIRQSSVVIEDFRASPSGLYVKDIDGGPSQIRFHDFFALPDAKPPQQKPEAQTEQTTDDETENEAKEEDESKETKPAELLEDKRQRKLPLKGILAAQELVVLEKDQLLFRTVGFTAPAAWNLYDPNDDKDKITPTELRSTSPVEFVDVEVVREFALSKDGTKVPLSIVCKKGTRLDGQNPTLLTGYGGYGISLAPRFDFTRRIWFDQGGVYVVANLRGGGEYGEEWHKAGSLTNKQNVFDDFIACAEFLIRSNYTNPAKLAIEGGSNGGLLMAAALTQRPDLFQAVVSHVGVYDMLRVELDPNGAFNVTEFGSVKDPDQFRALFAYSPYHHMAPKAAYPAALLLTGENDGRVNPAHSRKMTARLQAATGSKRPILLRTSANSGHGLGTALDERIAQLADVYSFLLDQLGIEYSLIDRGPWAGAVTPTSTLIKAKLAREDMGARLVLSQSPLLTRPVYAAPVRASHTRNNLVAFPLDRLKPDTQYYYALEVESRLERRKRGAFRTFPEGPASFTFAYGSCARTGSTSDVFDRIRESRPLFFMNLGDFHYLDIRTNDVKKFRAAYDAVLASPQQSDLYREVPFNYVWDDHDFGGNNANRKASSHEAARRAYDEYVPHYRLAGGTNETAIYHSFTVGRVKFIVTDLRSERDDIRKKDDPAKTMMGAKQKEWFKHELLSAKGKYPLIFWATSVPWLGQSTTNYYRVASNHFGLIYHTNLTNLTASNVRTNRSGRPRVDQDHWSVFSTERREIADFIKANRISGLAILHGDAHMLGADDGRHGDYATGGGIPIPVMCGGPLDQSASLKGGPYSQGVYRMQKGESGFGLINVTDHGNEIVVNYSGRNNRNEEKISLRFTVPVGRAFASRPGT